MLRHQEVSKVSMSDFFGNLACETGVVEQGVSEHDLIPKGLPMATEGALAVARS